MNAVTIYLNEQQIAALEPLHKELEKQQAKNPDKLGMVIGQTWRVNWRRGEVTFGYFKPKATKRIVNELRKVYPDER